MATITVMVPYFPFLNYPAWTFDPLNYCISSAINTPNIDRLSN